MKLIKIIFILTIIALPFLSACSPTTKNKCCGCNIKNDSPVQLKLMTFNTRYPNTGDGENAWPNRKEALFTLLNEYNCDLMGFQEVFNFQIADFQTALPQYDFYSIGRDDGETQGEACTIAYKRDRFEKLACGTFWLSDTPEKIASKTWGNDIPRICSWLHLKDNASDKAFYLYNAHFDHISQNSREMATKLIAKIISEHNNNDPYILMGDFNMPSSNSGMQYLLTDNDTRPIPTLTSTWKCLNPDTPEIGSHHGFSDPKPGHVIDHILVEPDTIILNSIIDTSKINGRYPSDHFPLISEIILK